MGESVRARDRFTVIDGALADNCPPAYQPERSLVDNAFTLARSMWGTLRAEWSTWLAGDVLERFPEAGKGRQKRGWVAGILVVTALDRDCDAGRGPEPDPQHAHVAWQQTLDDILVRTQVSEKTALRRFVQLVEAGLDRPVSESSTYWR